MLDPFTGTGTVGLVADRLGRGAVLLEISEKYADVVRRRFVDSSPLLVDVRTS